MCLRAVELACASLSTCCVFLVNPKNRKGSIRRASLPHRPSFPIPSNLWRQVITASHDKTIRLWDLRTGKTLSTLTHHKKAVRISTQCHPDTHPTAAAMLNAFPLPTKNPSNNVTLPPSSSCGWWAIQLAWVLCTSITVHSAAQHGHPASLWLQHSMAILPRFGCSTAWPSCLALVAAQHGHPASLWLTVCRSVRWLHTPTNILSHPPALTTSKSTSCQRATSYTTFCSSSVCVLAVQFFGIDEECSSSHC